MESLAKIVRNYFINIVEPIKKDLLITYPLFVGVVTYDNNASYLDNFGQYFVSFNLVLLGIRTAMTIVPDLLINRSKDNSINLRE